MKVQHLTEKGIQKMFSASLHLHRSLQVTPPAMRETEGGTSVHLGQAIKCGERRGLLTDGSRFGYFHNYKDCRWEGHDASCLAKGRVVLKQEGVSH